MGTEGAWVGEQAGKQMGVTWGGNGKTQAENSGAPRKMGGLISGARVKAGVTERWGREEGLTQEVRDRGEPHRQAGVPMGTHGQSWGFLGDKRGHGMGVEDAGGQREESGVRGTRVSHKGEWRTCLREHGEGAREGPRSLGR